MGLHRDIPLAFVYTDGDLGVDLAVVVGAQLEDKLAVLVDLIVGEHDNVVASGLHLHLDIPGRQPEDAGVHIVGVPYIVDVVSHEEDDQKDNDPEDNKAFFELMFFHFSHRCILIYYIVSLNRRRFNRNRYYFHKLFTYLSNAFHIYGLT